MENISTRVIREIAGREGIDPIDVTPPLYEVIDPEALDSLFHPGASSNTSNGTIRFSYSGYRVTVQSTGHISIAPETPERKFATRE